MTPDEIAARMDGRLVGTADGRREAFLASPMVQNHAAFIELLDDGTLACLWFGGTLEGKSDISIHGTVLKPGADAFGPTVQLSHDAERSEQNPVLARDGAGKWQLIHTAQPAGNQDECLLRIRPIGLDGDHLSGGEPREIALPLGTFVRARFVRRKDGAWLMPVFRCISRPGQRWNGSHDTAGVAASLDDGKTWTLSEVPGSIGSVHMTIVPLDGDHMVAFYRRRQSDFVHRSESLDGGLTWSAPMPTDVPNNNSSINVIRLADGRLAMVCNPVSAATSADRRASLYDELAEGDDRPDATGGCAPIWGVPRAPLTLCISTDGGLTWPIRRIVDDSPGTCLTNNSVDGKNFELSYPYLLEGPDGAIHVAYTYFRRAIKYVRLPAGWIDGEFVSDTIGITMGDPAGVGPEISVKAVAEMAAEDRARTRIYGNRATLERALEATGLMLNLDEVVVDLPIDGGPLPWGKLDPRAGDAAFRFIEKAVRDAQAGKIGCIVTAPINKEALNVAGHHYDGHTGMLAALTGQKTAWMLLGSDRLKVIHVSTHVSLKTAIDRATPERILATIRTGNEHLKRIGYENPRIAVAGINPHCGENGLFGSEDDLQVVPAVTMAKAEGINVVGPISADTVYHRAYNGAFDLVIAQYHDQGHIPIKLVAFDTAVNVSLGLPIDRTSVDHGTAFDIAGTGKANHTNMNSAIAYARRLVAGKN